MGINSNMARVGNFTSSEIVALLGFGEKGRSGDAAIAYIQECNMERRLGRSLTDESNARPLMWGKIGEIVVFEYLPLDYTLTSEQTIVHPDYPFWAGSKDGHKPNTVFDIKSPYTHKSFCQLVQPLYDGLEGTDAMNAIRNGYTDDKGLFHAKHRDGDKFYTQLVSNACIDNVGYAELIVFMPYKSQLDAFRKIAMEVPSEELYKYYFIAMGQDDELPFLLDNGYYKNINTIRFKVPDEDKELLTEKVRAAGELLIDFPPSIITATYDPSVNATIIQP